VTADNNSILRVPLPLSDAAEAVVDSFIALHDATHHAEYGSWRELRAFKTLADAIEELELTLSCTEDVQVDRLRADATTAVITFHELHRVGADDGDGELFSALDDGMYNLGTRHFGRAHAH
jgi:hypothetical protein